MYLSILFIAATLISFSLAIFVLAKDRHSLGHRVFALGMAFFGMESIFTLLSFRSAFIEDIIYWQRWRLLASGFLPGTWLLFSLIFGRANYEEFLKKWRWGIVGSFAVPLSIAAMFGHVFFTEESQLSFSLGTVLRVSPAGYTFQIAFLLISVFILMNLEWTLRTSIGRIRWQIKFMVLGLGGLFAVRVFVLSQGVLYKAVTLDLQLLNTAALIIGSLLTLRSFSRARLINVSFYVSGPFIYNSITILCVGVYLFLVGVLAKAGTYIQRDQQLPFDTFFIFLAMLGLVIFLLSDKLRKKTKRFISRHFKRPTYDYQKEWIKFTQWTSSVLKPENLCANITKELAKTLDVLSVTIWLMDERRDKVILGATSVFSEGGKARDLATAQREVRELIRTMRQEKFPVDFDYSSGAWMPEGNGAAKDFFNKTRIKYALPLSAGGRFVGVMTIGDRVANDPLSPEDFELLGTIADQTASSLLNLQLAADLQEAKEMEAFQNMSTFFIHDLKNVASRLSLTMQNLPIYFDNPEFREDTLKTISQSLLKINSMCSQLSSLSQKLELQTEEVDLRDLVKKTTGEMNGALKSKIVEDFPCIGRIQADPEQIQKVLTNLILNANDAIQKGGEIKISTQQPSGYVLLCVSDTGCGMSKEFIENSLFRPFKTTKQKGMGIGLFHSKKIIEAHGGRIEVESEPGNGTTFKVYLPVKGR